MVHFKQTEQADGTEPPLAPGWCGERTRKACIFGLGLMGGSWAGALHAQGWEVCAIDPHQKSLDEALRRGWIQSGWTEMPSFLDVDLVVLALPLGELEQGLNQLEDRIPRGAIVTDVGSIKTRICHQAHIQAQQGCIFYFVGGHPMTGSEQSGFTVSDPNLFYGYPYVLIPAAECPEYVVSKLVEVIQGFGAHVVFRSPEDHDSQVAVVSHLPHVLAVALALTAQDISPERAPLALAGRSFRDLTRIADSSPILWKEIMVKNAPAILEGLTLWEQKIKNLREWMECQDGEAIAEAFRQAHEVRTSLAAASNFEVDPLDKY